MYISQLPIEASLEFFQQPSEAGNLGILTTSLLVQDPPTSAMLLVPNEEKIVANLGNSGSQENALQQ